MFCCLSVLCRLSLVCGLSASVPVGTLGFALGRPSAGRWFRTGLWTFLLLACGLLASTASGLAQEAVEPRIAAASQEGELALQGFRLPEGMRGQLLAAEPLLANPVAFTVTGDGRIFVCETFRQELGVEDNRGHMNWLNQDLQLESVEERLAMFRRYMGDDVQRWTAQQERIRLLRDVDGDGRFEQATVFADGFNELADGTGAGVIELQGRVYYTCIPKLWMLEDADDDGVAESRAALHHGYGVRVAFRGHDLHGLTIGPDGRLYFSLGDRGYNVVTQEGTRLKRPDTGAVFRCDPDGSHLEVFAHGLRNPQELAFDDRGQLFTGDNNSDSGDRARWVYVVQDGDTGWRMYFQYLDDRGPWNRERMWYPWQADQQTQAVQPAYIIPPVANLADGPSGLTYYPGTGLPARYAGHFFMADFRGTPGNSGIRSFAVQPRGATYELTDAHEFIWSVLATDVDFAPDGSLYVSDWVNGWSGEGKGRMYRFVADAAVAETGTAVARLLGGDVVRAGTPELLALLAHADRRVRQQAQFELVRRDAREDLLTTIRSAQNPVARRHALWAAWQLGLQSADGARLVAEWLSEVLPTATGDAALQTLRILADLADRHGVRAMLNDSQRDQLRERARQLLEDEDAQLTGFAAVLLGAVGREADAVSLLSLLDRCNNADPVVRHQASLALWKLGRRSPGLLAAHSGHSGAAGRLGLVLALRRQQDPAIATFLQDADAAVATEAARAINDEPIEAGLAALANLASVPGLNDPVQRRVLNACYRLGTLEHAAAVASVAADASASDELRLVAAEMLRTWNQPRATDTVTGRWSPLPQRDVTGLPQVVQSRLPSLLAGSERLRAAAVEVAAALGITDVVPALEQLLSDKSGQDALRVSAFRALSTLSADVDGLLERGLADPAEPVRMAALQLLASRRPEQAVAPLEDALTSGSLAARQQAVRLLGELKLPRAEELLLTALQQLQQGRLEAGVALDLLEAAAAAGTPELQAEVSAFRRAQQEAGTVLAQWSECLTGGDAQRGQAIFFGRSAASCRRCHRIQGSGGEVGPDLSLIGRDKERSYLLEALVDPSAKIAKGFETVIIVTDEGRIHTGVLRREDDLSVQLMSPEGAVITIAKERIEDRASGQSGMPADIAKNLSRSEIRDLVEYLSTLRAAAPAAHGGDH